MSMASELYLSGQLPPTPSQTHPRSYCGWVNIFYDNQITQLLFGLILKWSDGAQKLKSYQHGREYNVAGLDTGSVINWFTNREQIAQHAKEMVVSNYGVPTTVTPQIVRELDATNTLIHETDARRLLGLTPPSSSASHGQPRRESEQHNSTSSRDSNPRSRRERPPAAEASSDAHLEQGAGQPQASWFHTVLDIIGWFTRNVEFNVDLGGTRRGQNFSMSNAYRGTLDPRSSVDVMKSFGLDSSREGRLRYAANHGIGGDPFSAAWGDAIRRDVLRRHG